MQAIILWASGITPNTLWLALLAVTCILLVQSARSYLMRRKIRHYEMQLAELEAIIAEREAHYSHLREMSDAATKQLEDGFEDMAKRIMSQQATAFTSQGQVAIESMLRPFREQVQEFQKRVNEIHAESLRSNVSLNAEIKRVVEMGMQLGTDASNLAQALKGDKKLQGNWGEYQLEQALQQLGMVRDHDYVVQATLTSSSGKRLVPDFLICLPENRHLVIDSKVSLADYTRAVAAETSQDADAAMSDHVKAVKRHIDDLSAKDYSAYTGSSSPGFVLMFMPVEAAFTAALRHDPQLFDYGWSRNVILLSYSTLMPVLKVVANLWTIVRSNEQAQEISRSAGEIYNQVAVTAERLKKLGASLSTVSRHYNDTVVAVAGQQGLFGKVERFTKVSAQANKDMIEPDALHADFQHERLDRNN